MTTRLIENIAYSDAGGQDILLDLLLPDPMPQSPAPLIVEIHGGGWMSGCRNGAGNAFLAERGYITASIDYRLTDEAVHPAQIDDCRDAIRWLRAHSAEYAIDPNRIGVWGSSAGGHLAALLGTSAASKPDGKEWCVQAVVDLCGPTEIVDGDAVLITQVEYVETLSNVTGTFSLTPRYVEINLYETFLGGPIATHADAARDASPLHFVGPNMPSFLILHCEDDDMAPVRHTIEFDAALKAAGADVTTVIYPTGGHGFEGHWGGEIERAMVDFFDRTLGN